MLDSLTLATNETNYVCASEANTWIASQKWIEKLIDHLFYFSGLVEALERMQVGINAQDK